MSAAPWVPFYPSDWLAGTRGLSAPETGIYITLIMMMYERGSPIDRNDARQSRLCGASNSTYKVAIEHLISEKKITLNDGKLWNDRVGKELVYLSEKSEVGRAKALKRWGTKDQQNQSDVDAVAFAVQCTDDANHNHREREGTPDVVPSPLVVDLFGKNFEVEKREDATSKASVLSRARGTRLTEDWVLPKAFGDYALGKGLTRERILIEAEQMKNWSINAGSKGVKINWMAAWRNWVQRVIERLPSGKSGYMSMAEKRDQYIASEIQKHELERMEDGSGSRRENGVDWQVDEPVLIGASRS